ncbi:MAG: hypothetical protein FWD31_07760 [Planctomycetaceae bacterium]|nr:hypothetical protein [Planctomycetaceae bacterium]
MTFVCILAFGVLVVLAVITGAGSLAVFINCPSIVAVVAGVLLFVLASGRWTDFSHGMKHLVAWQRSLTMDRQTAVRISRFFRMLCFATLGIGAFWSLTGLVIMLSDLNLEIIGPAVAMCLMTLFYSFFLSFVVFLPISLYYDDKE